MFVFHMQITRLVLEKWAMYSTRTAIVRCACLICVNLHFDDAH